jgi:hypothetical protein
MTTIREMAMVAGLRLAIAALGFVAGRLRLSAEERLAVVAWVGRALSAESPAR